MNLKVRFIFENSDIKSKIELLNPPVIPSDGETVSFKWSSFISNKKDLKIIAKIENDLVALTLRKHYSKCEVLITILLMTDIEYKKYLTLV